MNRPSYPKTKASSLEKGNRGGILWELKPCGMLVQKRSGQCGMGANAQPIKVSVSHGLYQYEINVPAQATFGELKRVIWQETGLEMKKQRILFQGKERKSEELLHMAGVKNNSKVVLMEDSASRERNVMEMKTNHAKGCEAIAQIRTEVDKLVEKVSVLESRMRGDKRISEKEITILTELLMVQLLKLDSIEADGEAKSQRRIEVRRIQSNVEILDMLKTINTNPFTNRNSVSTQWESHYRSKSADSSNKWNIYE
ncbi:hypothetical protein LUZ60_010979 [Juncus effusus]|nr:hypothetical protein LUZ60_010979 [Juncus effusus]